MFFLIGALFLGLSSNLECCCRRAKHALLLIQDNSCLNLDADSNPEPAMRYQRDEPPIIINRPQAAPRNEHLFCFGVGAISGVVFTLVTQKLFSGFQD